MTEKSQVLCKYHVAGVCRFGADCAFSHNLADLPNQICKYYLAGCCVYGDRCRYDHKRPDYRKAKTSGARNQQAQTPPPQQRQHGQPQTSLVGRTDGGSSNGRDGGGGGAAVRGDQYALAWDAPEPHDPSRLPRALAVATGTNAQRCATADVRPSDVRPSRPSNGALGGGSRTLGPSADARNGGGNPGSAGQSWEELPEAEEDWVQGDSAEGGYDVYDGGYDEYDGILPDSEDVEGAAWAQADATYDNDTAAAGAPGHAAGGLLLVDDDLGLAAEARAVGRITRRALPGPPGVDDGGGDGKAEVAAAGSCWESQLHPWELTAAGGAESGEPVDPADVELCPKYALHGRCGEGDDCRLIHGLECEICHKYRIHPYNAEEAEEHRATCRLRHERLEARLRSSGVECGICLEPVLSKPSVADRRFGLMACDHAFCLSCIRSWRERTNDASLATDTAVRTCPICRTPTHFITPSLVWPATAEEKEGIMATYQAKLSAIDCKHFDFGDGTCPFSTSCFYRHMYRDGRLEEPTLRRAGNADGDVRVMMPVRLSAFFDTPQARRLLSRRR